jgi:hypothetical protein
MSFSAVEVDDKCFEVMVLLLDGYSVRRGCAPLSAEDNERQPVEQV